MKDHICHGLIDKPCVICSKPKPWDEFNRTNWPDAYCCIDDKGNWFDSGADFATALLWCCCIDGIMSPTTVEAVDHMQKSGYSIITLAQCKRMYEAGLIT